MYSGFAMTNYSGAWWGVHQKFDRIAYRHLRLILKEYDLNISFPSLAAILHFEGLNGPDGLKVKSPGHCEPQHFYNPYKPQETDLIQLMKHHLTALEKALVVKDGEKAAWEAAWLAHIIVDGLTPAHHFPYEAEMVKLRGIPRAELKISDKVLAKPHFFKQSEQLRSYWLKIINHNWQIWGNKGLVLTHGLFEVGVALIVKPLSFERRLIKASDWLNYQQQGLIKSFQATALLIAERKFYNRFYLWGWTPRLAGQVKNLLAPLTIKLVILAWLDAILKANAKVSEKINR